MRSGVLVPPDTKTRDKYVGLGVSASSCGDNDAYLGRNVDECEPSNPQQDSAKDGGGAGVPISMDSVEALDIPCTGDGTCRL